LDLHSRAIGSTAVVLRQGWQSCRYDARHPCQCDIRTVEQIRFPRKLITNLPVTSRAAIREASLKNSNVEVIVNETAKPDPLTPRALDLTTVASLIGGIGVALYAVGLWVANQYDPLRLSQARAVDRNAVGSAAALLGEHRRVGPRRRERPGGRSSSGRLR
jgi:hypothetical protein